MQHSSGRDVEMLSGFLEASYALRDPATFGPHLVANLSRLIDCDSLSYNEIDLRRRRVVMLREPAADPRLYPAFVQHFKEHPGYQHFTRVGETTAIRLSDHLSRAKYHRLGLYNEYYRHVGVEHQITVSLAARPVYVAVALNRGWPRDFSGRDVSLLTIIGRHLLAVRAHVAALAEARADLAAALDGGSSGGRALAAVVKADRVIAGLSPRLRHLLERYFGSQPRRSNRLPSSLANWVARQLRAREAQEPPLPPRPLVVRQDNRTLVLRLHGSGPRALLFLEEAVTGVIPAALDAIGLTPREAQVLTWAAEGKTSPVIAQILGASVRTVHHHLEHVYRKLGVESRTAAATEALRISAMYISEAEGRSSPLGQRPAPTASS